MSRDTNSLRSRYPSPVRLLVLTALTIFGTETAIMGLFVVVRPASPLIELFIDSTLLAAVTLPILYFFMYRPMRRYIDENMRIHEDLHYRTMFDALTDLPNRNLFHDRLEHEIAMARRNRATFGLILIDVARFKEINDTLGHRSGDDILRQISARLAEHWRRSDTIARLGADQFALLLPGVNLDVAVPTAEKLQAILSAPFVVEQTQIEIELHCGIAVYPDHGEDADFILRRADTALNGAKKAGENCAVYVAEHDDHSVRRLAMYGQLRNAIKRDELMLYFQPKIDLKTGLVSEAEALVRWRHPEHGLVPPGEFIPLAERTNLIKPLTEWVVDATLRQIRAWEQRGADIRIAVNFSARNLADSGLPSRVEGLLGRWGIAPAMLIGEITESAVMLNPERAAEILNQLNGMGVALSIDDFGTGFGSLTYLRKLPVQELKIDQSFVFDIDRNRSDAAIVRSIISLAHNLGLTVAAEGVENDGAMRHLVDLGCDKAQGYYISRPLPADDFSRWFDDHLPKVGAR